MSRGRPPDPERAPAPAMETDASADSRGTTDAPHRTRDGIGDFRVGDAVRVRDGIRGYGGRTGTVAALNDRDGEVGVTFSSERSHDAAVWFNPEEVAVEVGQGRHSARSAPASPSVAIGAL